VLIRSSECVICWAGSSLPSARESMPRPSCHRANPCMKRAACDKDRSTYVRFTRCTVFCMPSSLHRFLARERKRKKCSDGAPVRFLRAALSGVWDLSCSVSSFPPPILVLLQSRLWLGGRVVCVVELAARISGRYCRRRQRAQRCFGLRWRRRAHTIYATAVA
jgi:hypothetical protein